MQLMGDWKLPVDGNWDVVVCGAGPSGCAAALAARRAGQRVLLVESQGQLGGMGTSGLVSHWLGGRTNEGGWVVGGLFRELSEEATRQGFATLPKLSDFNSPYPPYGWISGLVHGVPFDPFRMAQYLDRKLSGEGIDILLDTRAVEVRCENRRITQVVLANRDGLTAAGAAYVIDATGNAEVAARAGCETRKGDAEGLMTPVTVEFHVDQVDEAALSAYIHEHKSPRFRELILDLRQKGIWDFPYEIFIAVRLDRPGVFMINTPRICLVDGTNARSYTDGMMRGRAEVMRLFDLMRAHFPGFANATLKTVAPALGVRETRRIVAERELTVESLLKGEAFPDVIGYTGYGWDLPDPRRPSYQPLHESGLKPPRFTPLPYGIMVPCGIDNLLCPGRAVGVERDVLGPIRVMAPCMAMGEAAGVAVGLAAPNAALSHVNPESLRNALRLKGAIVDNPSATV